MSKLNNTVPCPNCNGEGRASHSSHRRRNTSACTQAGWIIPAIRQHGRKRLPTSGEKRTRNLGQRRRY